MSIANNVSPALVAERISRREKSAQRKPHGLDRAIVANLVAQLLRPHLALPEKHLVKAYKDEVCAALSAPKMVCVPAPDFPELTEADKVGTDRISQMRRRVSKLFQKAAAPSWLDMPKIDLAPRVLTSAIRDARRLVFGHVFDAIAESASNELLARERWSAVIESVFGGPRDIRSDDVILGYVKGWTPPAWHTDPSYIPTVDEIEAAACSYKVRPCESMVMSIRDQLVALGVTSAQTYPADGKLKLRVFADFCRSELELALARRPGAELANELGDSLWEPVDKKRTNRKNSAAIAILTVSGGIDGSQDDRGKKAEKTKKAANDLLDDAQDVALGLAPHIFTFGTWGDNDGASAVRSIMSGAEAHTLSVAATNLELSKSARLYELETARQYDECAQALSRALSFAMPDAKSATTPTAKLGPVDIHFNRMTVAMREMSAL